MFSVISDDVLKTPIPRIKMMKDDGFRLHKIMALKVKENRKILGEKHDYILCLNFISDIS